MNGSATDPRIERATAGFAAVHREDPRTVSVEGTDVPWSVHYHRRLLEWVLRFDPEASVSLRLAAACQHLARWKVPRSDYELGRSGYRRWRSDLARAHAEDAAGILEDVGLDDETIGRVQALVRKIGLKRDAEVQLFEDAICMVFFENELVPLSRKHSDDKMTGILARTWGKMSEPGRATALELAPSLPERERRLLDAAILELKSGTAEIPEAPTM